MPSRGHWAVSIVGHMGWAVQVLWGGCQRVTTLFPGPRHAAFLAGHGDQRAAGARKNWSLISTHNVALERKPEEKTRSFPQKLPPEECPPSKPQTLQGALDFVTVLSGTLAGRGRFPRK